MLHADRAKTVPFARRSVATFIDLMSVCRRMPLFAELVARTAMRQNRKKKSGNSAHLATHRRSERLDGFASLRFDAIIG
jgi:hypothetical protein